MRREPEVVKKQRPDAPQRSGPRNFRRHLQGYELGLVTLGVVVTFGLLALPRASVPETLPLPLVDHVLSERYEALQRDLAAAAERDGLPFDVRAVGEAIRHFGASSAQRLDPTHDRQDIQERVRVVLEHRNEQSLLQLRAVQTEYFMRELEPFEQTGTASANLNELGGDFVLQAQRSGWLDAKRHSLAGATTLRVLYRARWAELVGMRRVFPFATSLNDSRIYYRFLLLHPERLTDDPRGMGDDAMRLKLVAALSRTDPDYPTAFARGYLLFRLGDREGAATAYRSQLAHQESGPYALLARNYLIFALQDVSSE
ncbi:MAG: hypothetical protein ABI488_26830 [Polyangiaceae bacterium]